MFILGLVGGCTVAASPSGEKFACATTCHSPSEAHSCAAAIGQKAYSMARSSSLTLPGFPDFEKVVAELKSSATETATPDFEVCVPVPNGLAIKQSLVDYWSSMDMFSTDMASLLEKHNKKYNVHGIKRGHAEVEASSLLFGIKVLLCFCHLF